MVYPLKCKPIYKEKIWGGSWFEKEFGRELPANETIGESWELACRTNEMSRVNNGEQTNKRLLKVINEAPGGYLGRRVLKQGYNPFPLLIKFLDANDRLSVQVHPDNEYASKNSSGELGKTEMWYVLDADPDAKLIMGVKEGVTPEEFERSIEEGNLGQNLNQVPIKAGDAFYIPAGTVHAILEGVRIAEIQQNSDTTYRVYDWNRMGLDGKPRQLHIDEAMEVIDFGKTNISPIDGIKINHDGWEQHILTACPYFAVEVLEINSFADKINPERFEVWMILEGEGILSTEKSQYSLEKGQTWFIPAQLGNIEVSGQLKVLKSYIPDIQKEIVETLLNAGFEEKDLKRIGGIENI